MSIYNTITNAQMATMPANTFKGNNGGSPAPPIDVTVAQLQAVLNTSGFASGQVLFGGASSVIQGATALTFNVSTSVLALTGQFNASIATLSAAGVSALNLNGFGGNVSMTLGSNGVLGQAFAATAFLHDSVAGDVCIRNSSASNSLLLGISTATSNIAMSATVTSFNLPVTFPQTQSGLAVTGSVKTNIEYMENPYVHTTAMTGAISIASYVCQVKRENTTVTLTLPPWSGTATASATEIFSTALPARFRPTVLTKRCEIGNRNGQTSVAVQVDTTGIITFFGDTSGGNFANNQTAGFDGSTFTYSVV